MKKLSIVVIVLLISFQGFSQEMRISLWPEGKVPNHIETGEKEIIDSGETIGIRFVQSPDIAVFLPTKRLATGQAVIICPGGGYNHLSWTWEGTDIAKWLNSKGIAAFVLKYRLPNSKSLTSQYMVPLMDAKRAIRIVRYYASKWNIKKDQVGIMGFSAGGHLASTLGTHFDAGNPNAADSIEQQSSRPDFMILMYPVITMSKPIMHTGSRNMLIGEKADTAMANLYSNELQVTNNTPPTFIIHTVDDKTVPVENAFIMYEALKAHNVPVEMHIFPTGGHGYGFGTGKGTVSAWPELCISWLQSLGWK